MMQVLVTDDDQAMAECLRAVLESVGYVTEVARSGAEALERVQHQVPDCILLDLKMPGISGPETLSRLRQLGATCPVIFMTGYAPGRLVEGRNGIIAKLDQHPESDAVRQFLVADSPRRPLLIGHPDPDFCRALRQDSERLELPTLMTTSVDRALVAFESQSSQVVILHLLTDSSPGFVASELKPGLVVHLLTLKDQGGEGNRLGYLQKPFPMEDLIDAVDQRLGHR